jgi:deoxycytidylate deaminase
MKKFRLAKLISIHSLHQHKIGAVIYKNNKPISVGFNKIKSHPKLANEDRFYALHAEMSAIINAKQDLTNCTIFVYREYKDGKPALAKPCDNCLSSIIESGIKKIFYSDSNDQGYSVIKL